MRTSATNRRIRALITAIRDGQLIPRPEFQRRLVWSNKHKLHFLDTVLKGFPFPEIYIAAGDLDPDTGEASEMLVDGQQRVTTLYQYFTGSEDLRLGKDIRPYQELEDREKREFLEYEVVVRDLGQKSIKEIQEIFERINSTRYALNAMEVQNARYAGAFKQFGEKLAQHEFFERHRVFHTNEVRRMNDVRFVLVLAVSVLSTYFNRDSELEDYLAKYDEEFPDAKRTNAELERVFAFIDALALDEVRRVWNKADLLTLLVESHRALIRDGLSLDPGDVRARLLSFYGEADQAQAGEIVREDVAIYHNATIQASNDRKSRRDRGEILAQILRGDLSAEEQPMSLGN